MPYSFRRDAALPAPVPAQGGAGSRPGPYESPRQVLRGYDHPAPALPEVEREAPVHARGRDSARR